VSQRGGEDASDSGGGEDLAFGYLVVAMAVKVLGWRVMNPSRWPRASGGFLADIHHAGTAFFVRMGKRWAGHGDIVADKVWQGATLYTLCNTFRLFYLIIAFHGVFFNLWLTFPQHRQDSPFP